MPRSRRQSVCVSDFEVLPVVSPFMGFRSPCGYDVSLVVVPVGVDHGNLDAVHHSDRVDANLTVIEAIIDAFNGRPVEDPSGIRKGNRVPTDIEEVLVRVPGEPHGRIYVLCLPYSRTQTTPCGRAFA